MAYDTHLTRLRHAPPAARRGASVSRRWESLAVGAVIGLAAAGVLLALIGVVAMAVTQPQLATTWIAAAAVLVAAVLSAAQRRR